MYYTTTQRHESESTLAIQNFESLSWKKGHEPQWRHGILKNLHEKPPKVHYEGKDANVAAYDRNLLPSF
jgi:hypothetical protein